MYLFNDYSPQSIIFAIVFGRFLKSYLYGNDLIEPLWN